MVTNSCNLRCSYCYEIGKRVATVDVAALKNALKLELESCEYKNYVVSFHGGEPFLAFNVIKEICEWIWENYSCKKVAINATTNGTVLNLNIKEWLIANRDKFRIILSIDGRADTHNKNRDASFEKIDKEFILSLYDGRPNAKMTIVNNNLSHLYDNFIYLYELGFMPDFSIASGVDWDVNSDISVYENQLMRIVSFFVENPQLKLPAIFNIPLHKYSPYFNTNGCGFCGTGLTTIAYDVTGNKYPCHTFISDLSKPYDAIEIANVFQKLQNIDNLYQESRCKDCRYSISCSPCFGMNYTKRGQLYELDTCKCEFTKSTIIASAKLYAQALSRAEEYVWLRNKTKRELMHLI